MSQIQSFTGRGVPLSGNDIDTDRIIPARFLRCVTFDGLGAQVFADDRQQAGGQHPFDLAPYQGAQVLLVNANFGCGSSREHAPQALAKWGIKAIIGESFAEIFFGNCLALGIPCATVSPEAARQLQSQVQGDPTTPVTLDLVNLTATCGPVSIPVTMAEGPRQMLISGTWDSCGQLVANQPAIAATAAQLPYLQWA